MPHLLGISKQTGEVPFPVPLPIVAQFKNRTIESFSSMIRPCGVQVKTPTSRCGEQQIESVICFPRAGAILCPRPAPPSRPIRRSDQVLDALDDVVVQPVLHRLHGHFLIFLVPVNMITGQFGVRSLIVRIDFLDSVGPVQVVVGHDDIEFVCPHDSIELILIECLQDSSRRDRLS